MLVYIYMQEDKQLGCTNQLIRSRYKNHYRMPYNEQTASQHPDMMERVIVTLLFTSSCLITRIFSIHKNENVKLDAF